MKTYCHFIILLAHSWLLGLVDGDNLESTSPAYECSSSQIVPDRCPSEHECHKLGTECMRCLCGLECRYGSISTAVCSVPKEIKCDGNRTFHRQFKCAYCYQSDSQLHTCEDNVDCDSVAAAGSNRRQYVANCSVPDSLICLGRRTFSKQRNCNWTGGYKWTTALALSITLGGFGADRFYLGHWQEGIGKLFSFGGLGVWTLVDVVMVAIRYVGPADGSLYI